MGEPLVERVGGSMQKAAYFVIGDWLNMVETALKKALIVPVGRSVYTELRKDHCAYADRTALIPVLEGLATNNVFILRPRRFGKSLFVSMLETYYDCAQKEDFEENFSGTYIGEHKTPQQGRYFILHLDFSGIEVNQAVPLFYNYLKGALVYFLDYYRIEGRDDFLERSYTTPAELMAGFCKEFQEVLGHNHVFLFIDGYDPFADDTAAFDPDLCGQITSAEGFLKNFYSVIKSYAGTVFGRICMTGCLPTAPDTLGAVFGVATNYSQHPAFAAAFGFTESEMRQMIRETVDLKKQTLKEDEIFFRMKELYGGYRFSRDSEETVFHASMCTEYLRFLCERLREPEGSERFDASVAVDSSEIRRVVPMGDARFVRDVVARCLKGQTIPFVELSRTIRLNDKDKLDDQDVLTALFCMGYLTFASGKAKALVCPNKIIQELFSGYYVKYLSGWVP